MKRRHFWALGALPAAWVAAFWLGLAVTPGALAAGYIRAEIEAAKLLAFAGCVVAARAFSPGDYLRRAWSLLAACYACLLARDGLLLAVGEGGLVFGLRHGHVQAFLSTLANAAGLVGSLMIARAWHVAGLEPFGRPAARRAALALLVLVSLAIAGPPALVDAREVLGGNLRALVELSSDLGDLVSMVFVAPVFFTALALRGGRLRWPWAFMTASLLFWILYDACRLLVGALHLPPLSGRMLGETFRGLGCLYGLSAGVAQALALREPASARAAFDDET